VIRKFLTLDGDVLEETDWALKPTDKCFYCDMNFMQIFTDFDEICYESQDGEHDWITLVDPSENRR
jgi:hypothetical protein